MLEYLGHRSGSGRKILLGRRRGRRLRRRRAGHYILDGSRTEYLANHRHDSLAGIYALQHLHGKDGTRRKLNGQTRSIIGLRTSVKKQGPARSLLRRHALHNLIPFALKIGLVFHGRGLGGVGDAVDCCGADFGAGRPKAGAGAGAALCAGCAADCEAEDAG